MTNIACKYWDCVIGPYRSRADLDREFGTPESRAYLKT